MKEVVIVKADNTNNMLAEDEVIKAFNSTNDLVKIKEIVEKAEDRFYVTWATVDARDNEGEKIPIEDVIKQQDTLIRRNGPITDSHTNAIVGQTKAYKVLQHPETKTLGILHLNKIFKDNPKDDKVWNEIVTGLRKGSSVGGFTTQQASYEYDSGELTKVLHGFHQYETASAIKPMNPYSTNEAYSMVAKEDKEMTKEEVKKETTENTPKENVQKEEGDMKEQIMAVVAEMLQPIVDRLDAMEDATSGAPDSEEEKEDMPEEEKQPEEEEAKTEKGITKEDLVEFKKSIISEIKKEVKVLEVAKGSRPEQSDENINDVNKSVNYTNIVSDMIDGKKNYSWEELNKL